jgi:hypothetical protein
MKTNIRDETIRRLGIDSNLYNALSMYDRSAKVELNIENSTKDEIRQKIDFDHLKSVRGVGKVRTQKIMMWLNNEPLPVKQKRKRKTFWLFGKKITITLTIN